MVCLTEDSTAQEYQYCGCVAQCARLYSRIKEARDLYVPHHVRHQKCVQQCSTSRHTSLFVRTRYLTIHSRFDRRIYFVFLGHTERRGELLKYWCATGVVSWSNSLDGCDQRRGLGHPGLRRLCLRSVTKNGGLQVSRHPVSGFYRHSSMGAGIQPGVQLR